MRIPPRFAPSVTILDGLGSQAKQWACPHCRQTGWVNGHGWLRGLAEAAAVGKAALRGRRFLCSDRGQRRGCGRTFSVRLASVMAQATVRTGTFWRFIQDRLKGDSVGVAWAKGASGFSLEAAYGWWRRWRRGEARLRTALSRNRAPPAEALVQTLVERYGTCDPIAGFQQAEQQAWP